MNKNNFQDYGHIESMKTKGWKMFNFSDVLADESRKVKKIKKRDYLETGKMPIIDQGKALIGGYSNQDVGYYTETPFIVFGDHTRIIKYIDFQTFVGADGVKVLKNKCEDRVLTKYLYYYLTTINIPDTGYNRHFKYLKETIIPVPSIQKQKEIITMLDKVYEIIQYKEEQIKSLYSLEESIKSKFFFL